MKRKSRKEKAESQAETQSTDGENGVEEKSSNLKNSSDEEQELEQKKRKSSDKRKSGSVSGRKSLKKDKVEVEEDPQYEVEDILEEKFIKGIRHYLIRWKGYEPESDSWEPELTLNCPELIKKFKTSREENAGNDSPKKNKKNDSQNSMKKKNRTDSHKKSNKSNISPKKLKKNENSVEWNSDDEFEVDRIIEVYFKRNGKREFLVSWKGYPPSQDSWEPEENLECKNLIERFMIKVEAAKQVEQKELRVHRMPTQRFTLNMYEGDSGRRLSRRLKGKQRVSYHDAE